MNGRIQKEENKQGFYLPILGKLSVGELKKTGNSSYPTSLDYFRIDDKCRYKGPFHDKFGPEPKSLKISFISDNIEDVCNERWECWDNGKTRGFKYGYGDGETYYVYDPTKSNYVRISKTDPRFENYTKGWKWTITLTLRFVLLDLPGIMGQWQLTTRGKASSIPNITQTFDSVLQHAKTVRGLPFDLTITKSSGKMMKLDGSIQTTNFPVISLIPNFTEENVRAVQQYIARGGDASQVALLTMDFQQLNNEPNDSIKKQLSTGPGPSEEPGNSSGKQDGAAKPITITINTNTAGG